jgi:hypothetical protein
MPLLLSTEAGDRGKRPRRHAEAGAGTEWAGGRAARGGRDGWPRHATARRAGTGATTRCVAENGCSCPYSIFASRQSHDRECVTRMGLPLEAFFRQYSDILDPILDFGVSIGDSLSLSPTVECKCKNGLLGGSVA